MIFQEEFITELLRIRNFNGLAPWAWVLDGALFSRGDRARRFSYPYGNMRQTRTTLRLSGREVLGQMRRVVPIQGGEVAIQDCDLQPLTPLPTSWIMLKAGDFLVSRSGTIRMLIKKVWEAGYAECLRLRLDRETGQIIASLDLERMELNSSNFENLVCVVRDAALLTLPNTQLKTAHLTKSVRFNVLTLLGFGIIGSSLHIVIPALGAKSSAGAVRIGMQIESAGGQFLSLCFRENSPLDQRAPTSRKPFLEIELLWIRDERHRIFRITNFAFPSGTQTPVLEAVTLSSELANRISTVSSIVGEYIV